MSYDFSLIYKGILPGGHCPTCTTTPYVDAGNYTYNVYPMFQKAFGNKDGINVLEGMNCSEAAELLGKAIDYMAKNHVAMKKLNPDNGWGDYEGALGVLERLRRACLESPNLSVRIS